MTNDEQVARGIRLPTCPQCGGPLLKVRQPSESPWNADQFDSMKAGDYYCQHCPDNGRGKSGHCYWWERELPQLGGQEGTKLK